MKMFISVMMILFVFFARAFTQEGVTEFDNIEVKIISKKSSLESKLLNGQNQLQTIELVANSSGPITPQFIYKGVVDINAEPLVSDPVAFSNLINGNSMSSISPNDNGQFYVSQGGDIDLWRMLSYVYNAKRPMYQLRFGADDAGLAFDYFGTGAICRVPFTIWDLNGTPANFNDDIQMLPLIYSLNSDSTWGIRSGYPASWTDNPAQESDWIYIHYFNEGNTYSDLESAYQQQISTGLIDSSLFDSLAGPPILRRITINSLDANPLTTINSLNGLPRPAPGTIIGWTLFINLNIIPENLYGVVGESYNYLVNVFGWPIPTLSAIQFPPWLTLGNNFEIYGTPTTVHQGWNTIGLQASNSQGTEEGWYDMWVDMLPWNWIDHDNNNVRMSVFNIGKIGKAYPEGAGFQFNGLNGLVDADLIIALSDSQMSGGIYTERPFHEFATTELISFIPSPLLGFDQAFKTGYNDSRNVSPLGIRIVQQSYSKSSAPDNDYVILDYEIHNQNQFQINGLFVAIHADWDVGDAGINLGGYDSNRKLNYIYEENGINNSNYYGISVILGEVSGNSFTFINDDSILYHKMQSFEPPPTQPDDQYSMIASGPYNIPPNDAVRVVFSVLGGTDLSDIQANADAALNVNLNRRPFLADPVDGTTGVNLDPTLAWYEILGATEYHVQMATDINFTDIIRDNQGSFNSIQYSGLDPQSTYFWRVRAIYGADISDWSDVWSFTTLQLPVLTIQSATNITDVSATLNGEVNPNGHTIAVGFEYGEEVTYSTYISATPDTFSGTSNQFVYAEISGLRTDWDHHFRIVVNQVDGQFTIGGADQTFHTQSYPTTNNLSAIITFPTFDTPAEYTSANYKIFGLPGGKDSRLDLTNILAGDHLMAWQAYWDNGIYSSNSNDYLIEFDGSNNFRLGDGNAVWLVNKGDVSINLSGLPAMALDGDDNVRINLHNGWNLISSPFLREVPWSSIQGSNSISVPLFEFTGGWNTSEYLRPYQGFIFDNTDNLSELLIPYRFTLPKPPVYNEYQWHIDITLNVNDILDNSSYLGVRENSKKGKDKYDFRKPNAVGDIPSVYFNREAWDTNYSIYATDIRPPITDIEKWGFSVNSIPGEKSQLKFSKSDQIPANFEIVLIDLISAKIVDLRRQNKYQFISITEKTDFELLVGEKQFIDLEISEILPQEFLLGKNFPNPFNPSTIIPVAVPKESDINLKVYNILGQQIKIIYSGNKEPGKYYFKWDGTNYLNRRVPTGVYIYKLNTNLGHSFAGKMILVR